MMPFLHLPYLATVIEVSALLYAFYMLFLRRSIAYRLHRLYLLLALVIPILVPLLQFQISLENLPAQPTPNMLPVVAGFFDEQLTGTPATPGSPLISNASSIIAYLLAGGMLFFLIKICIQLFSLFKVLASCKKQLYNCQLLYVSEQVQQPFSFAGKIVIPSALLRQPETLKVIVAHETAHTKNHHQIDLLLYAACQVFCWWNPVVYLIRKQLVVVHEYEADAVVLQTFDRAAYARLLLSATFKMDTPHITYSFFQSPIKLRIMRFYENNSKPALHRFWFALPVIACITFLFCVSFVPVKSGGKAKAYKIVIDAGHGGIDAGASKNGINEKDLTLKVAQLMAKEAANAGIEVVMTRTEDELPVPGDKNASLKQRVEIVKSVHADAFVSLHVNASDDDKSGVEAFVSHNNNETTRLSKALASTILNSMQNAPLTVNMQVKQRETLGVWVLDQSPVPVVMLEIGYLTNDNDLKVLTNDANLEKMASMIVQGIKTHSLQ